MAVLVLLLSTACYPFDEDCEDLGNCEPLDVGVGYQVVCVQDRGSSDLTNGSNVIRYAGAAPLRIDEVDLVNGQGFGLAEVFVVPVHDVVVGSWPRWPPPRASARLSGARPAVGAMLGGTGPTAYNLVAHLTRTGAGASAPAALRIFYSIDGRGYGSVAAIRVGLGSC